MEFEIENGILKKYEPKSFCATMPDSLKKIGNDAFLNMNFGALPVTIHARKAPMRSSTPRKTVSLTGKVDNGFSLPADSENAPSTGFYAENGVVRIPI